MLRVLAAGHGTKSFLVSNPFVFTDNSRLFGAIFRDSDISLNRKEEYSLCRRYFCKGIDELRVLRFEEESSEREWTALTINCHSTRE